MSYVIGHVIFKKTRLAMFKPDGIILVNLDVLKKKWDLQS